MDDSTVELRKCKTCGEEKILVANFVRKICKSGHINYSKQCNKCRAIANRCRDQQNREQVRTRQRVYRARNREQINLLSKEWARKNKSSRHARRMIKLNTDPNAREKSRANATRYNARNREKARLRRHVRRARLKESSIEPIIKRQIDDLFNKQRGRCAICRGKLAKRHIDHIKPLSKGGAHAIWNLQLLCPPCNMRKHANDPIDFMQKMGFLL